MERILVKKGNITGDYTENDFWSFSKCFYCDMPLEILTWNDTCILCLKWEVGSLTVVCKQLHRTQKKKKKS